MRASASTQRLDSACAALLVLSLIASRFGLIDLTGNNLVGPVPPALATLTNLNALRFPSNLLTGTLPLPIFSMPNLEVLNLANNNLSGTIPILALQKLSILMLGHNQLTGTIPQDWSSDILQILSLENNNLVGTLPPPRLVTLSAYASNNLQLQLANNRLTGTVPAGLTYVSISHIDLSNNFFTGTINWAFRLLSTFELRLDNNMFTGNLQSFTRTSAQVFLVSSNHLTGTLPSLQAAALTELALGNNSFRGEMPAVLNAPNLQTFDLLYTGLAQTTKNSRGEYLPEYLHFDSASGIRTSMDVQNLQCQPVIADPQYLRNSINIVIEAHFFQYQTCDCMHGYSKKFFANGTLQCQQKKEVNWLTIFLPICLGLTCVIVCGAALHVWCVRYRGLAKIGQAVKLKGPPAEGRAATLVCTDVEGSTELWEWDEDAMTEAQAIHDRIIRSQLQKFAGYEVSTEGDAFTIVFHDAIDAVAWAISMQQALLTAKWPKRLEQHRQTCIRLRQSSAMAGYANFVAAQDAGSEEPLQYGVNEMDDQGSIDCTTGSLGSACDLEWLKWEQVDPKDILHWGLNVRMSIATGVAECVKVNPLSKRREYQGDLLKLAQGVLEQPNGGQIVIEGKAFNSINADLVSLEDMVSSEPDWRRVTGSIMGSHSQEELRPTTSDAVVEHMRLNQLGLHSSGDGTPDSIASPLQAVAESDVTHSAPPTPPGLSGVIRSGMTPADSMELERQGLTTGALQETAQTRRSMWTLKVRTPSMLGRTSSLSFAGHHIAGTLKAMADWRHPPQSNTLERRMSQETINFLSESVGIMVIDIGVHALPKIPGSHLLVQVAVPGLEERTRAPSLSDVNTLLRPGYFQAPATAYSPLNTKMMRVPLPSVTMVFCCIDKLNAMKAQNSSASEQAVAIFRDQVRRTLLANEGYECQESSEGAFMLAFPHPMPALTFCLMVQDSMLRGSWSTDILALPTCQLEIDASSLVIWNGPRICMGICEGEPSLVCPHSTSGRADYFGPVVNRAARFCMSACSGGQVVLPLPLAQKLVLELTGQHLEGFEHSPGGTVHPSKRSQKFSEVSISTAAQLSTETVSPSVGEGAPERTVPPSGGVQALTLGHSVLMQWPAFGQLSAQKVRRWSGSSLDKPRSVPETHAVTDSATAGASIQSRATSLKLLKPPLSPGTDVFVHDNDGTGDALGRHQSFASGAGTVYCGVPGGRKVIRQLTPERQTGLLSKRKRHAKAQVQQQEPVAMEIHHCGVYMLKGLPQPKTVMQINLSSLGGRTFGPAQSRKKAKLLAPARGLCCRIMLPLQSAPSGEAKT
ncbi:hypothetical protein WJX73_006132 [Symbiochloris irregularis]|uniref:Guanylate cyclase domain-containing protein n=1 Tax=Symbiochloris irregularis TaxID=706552 RepID=A0AAW1NPB9_9CHLO